MFKTYLYVHILLIALEKAQTFEHPSAQEQAKKRVLDVQPGCGAESVRGYLKQTVACVSYPFVPPIGWSYVDLADTAAAHTLAMLTPGASGRYIIDSEGLNAVQLAALLHPEYKQLKVPFLPLPYWIAWLGIRFFPKLVGSDLPFLECTYNKVPIFDTSKARRELGIEFFPVKKSMLDMTAALVKQGVVKLPPLAPKEA
eukprot:jgi/Botrbrau1/21361/Bobra.0184s0067.1